ncbi:MULTISPECIES: hypothetical protein [unclassified Microcoleus]|uniref:hypothetical protein n=1 Tax=unclassified Microcoleus TaxID=2642155 RepID=UPI002FD57612
MTLLEQITPTARNRAVRPHWLSQSTLSLYPVSKVSVDSCGGDKEAYQQFLATQQSKPYVRV